MIHTKGNIIVEDIKIGDIHYEFAYGIGIQSEVITLPVRDNKGFWTWKSRNINTDREIKYGVHETMSQYGPNLYDYVAYAVNAWI
jgi:hypothetical protein